MSLSWFTKSTPVEYSVNKPTNTPNITHLQFSTAIEMGQPNSSGRVSDYSMPMMRTIRRGRWACGSYRPFRISFARVHPNTLQCGRNIFKLCLINSNYVLNSHLECCPCMYLAT